jgi:hypothetical protein
MSTSNIKAHELPWVPLIKDKNEKEKNDKQLKVNPGKSSDKLSIKK